MEIQKKHFYVLYVNGADVLSSNIWKFSVGLGFEYSIYHFDWLGVGLGSLSLNCIEVLIIVDVEVYF